MTTLHPTRHLAVLLVSLAFSAVPRAASAQMPTNEQLLERIAALEAQLAELRTLVKGQPTGGGAPDVAAAKTEGGVEDYLSDLKYGGVLDTYYGFNFNRPVGRVNLLRAYDVTSNNFTLSQAGVLLESVPDVAAGRRFGARVDLQFGQATETLQGSLANEPRPWVYRNIFQAYGTYVFPLGSGLTVDFGKWASSLGIENNYNKDQSNYSRSYWFNYLPFYHMGVRATYRVNDAVAVNYRLHNGTQQTETFNNYKDQLFGAVINPVKSISWTINFHLGQEHPDVEQIVTPGPPTIPTQPGLSVTPIVPAPDGRTHIFDSYATWQATPSTSFSLEGDYVVSRQWQTPGEGRSTAPAEVYGGAVYARHQLTPKAAFAARAEYLRDDAGLFSGVVQSLKETTLTYEHKVADGMLMRGEWRRDVSNVPFFLTDEAGVLKKDQQTATLGLVWWWGNKTGAW
jgi:Putative beta-barrel porin-2, OmpL-like. bbp2